MYSSWVHVQLSITSFTYENFTSITNGIANNILGVLLLGEGLGIPELSLL